MHARSCLTLATVLLLRMALATPALAVEAPPLPQDPRLSIAFETDEELNGVAVSKDGRVFMPVQRKSPDAGIEVGEAVDGKVQAYPSAAWNGWSQGKDGSTAFVGVNALRIGPDGNLWIVDSGIPQMGEPPVPGTVKVVVVDLATDMVKRIYSLADSTGPQSFVDDIRLNGHYAYLTDAGKTAGLIVLDLETGKQRRLLEGDGSVVQGQRVLSGEGRPLKDAHGRPVVVNADQLEVSPDGKTFYYQPCTGPLYRIDTALLDDPNAKPEDVAKGVSVYADTHSTGGSAMAADGTIYISDTDTSAVLAIAPGGAISTLVSDPKLVWVDAMWIDEHGKLWVPASQRNRSKGMNGGTSAIQPPLQIFTVPIDARPVPH